jgi:hypothetical protein
MNGGGIRQIRAIREGGAGFLAQIESRFTGFESKAQGKSGCRLDSSG